MLGMKKFLIAAFAIPVILTLFAVRANAAVVEKQYDRTYTAQDTSVQVSETKTIKITEPSMYIPAGSEETFIIFNPIDGDPAQSEKLQQTLNSIKIFDNSGFKLSYSSETTAGKNLLITIRFPIDIYYGTNYQVTLQYISYGLLIKSGAIRDMYIPAFEKDYQFLTSNTKETVTTIAKIPSEFGDINFASPDVPVTKDGNFSIINYPEDKLVGATGWIQIGKTQYYSFKINQPYTPSTTIPFPYNTYKVLLPRDIKSGNVTQKVYFTKISPDPTSIYEDKDGNLIAEFKVPSTASGNIIVEGYGVLDDNTSYDPNASGILSDVNKSEFSSELASAKYWESGSIEIQQAARDIKGNETNVYKLVQAAYKFVVDKINYDDVKKFGLNERQGALKTLRDGAGVCMEYSDLFIALMRAMGVPARGAFGHGYSAVDYLSTQDNTINHQWAEVYIPGINSWIPVDTTWGENGPALIGGDLNHFYSHVATVDPDTPSTTEVTFYGSMSIPERDNDIEPVEKSFIDSQSDALTSEDLLKKFPATNSPLQTFRDLLTSLNLFVYTINQKIDNRLTNVISDAYTRSIVSTILELAPVMLFVLLSLTYAKKKQKMKFQMKSTLLKTTSKIENKVASNLLPTTKTTSNS